MSYRSRHDRYGWRKAKRKGLPWKHHDAIRSVWGPGKSFRTVTIHNMTEEECLRFAERRKTWGEGIRVDGSNPVISIIIDPCQMSYPEIFKDGKVVPWPPFNNVNN